MTKTLSILLAFAALALSGGCLQKPSAASQDGSPDLAELHSGDSRLPGPDLQEASASEIPDVAGPDMPDAPDKDPADGTHQDLPDVLNLDVSDVTPPADLDVGSDVPCVVDCKGKECGDDGCGGSCGECTGGDFCSGWEVCGDGVCKPGTPKDCNDGNPCTQDTCDAEKADCSHVLKPLDELVPEQCLCAKDEDCDELEDTNLCNGSLFCDLQAGVPVCKVDDSSVVVCENVPAGIDPACNVPICNAQTGLCESIPANENLACSDGNACTYPDLCTVDGTVDAQCVGSGPIDCDDKNPCTKDSCSELLGCQHDGLPGNPCEGGTGICVADQCCLFECQGKDCGPDGCGGSCGTCNPPTVCSAQGKCVCLPDCASKNCGPDGCGGSCGTCTGGTSCQEDQCVVKCGDGLCANEPPGAETCSSCALDCGCTACGETCSDGECKFTACSGKQCGPDGCGGTCGGCPAFSYCVAGICKPSLVHSWSKNLGGTAVDEASGVAVDSAGNVYVAGRFTSSSFSLAPQTPVSLVAGSDVFVAKLTNGAGVWVKGFGGMGDDRALGVAADTSSNVYVVGDFTSSMLYFDPLVVAGIGVVDAFLAKLDKNGNVVWLKGFGATGTTTSATGVAIDSAGKVWVTGSYTSSSLNLGGGSLPNQGKSDVFLAKFDSSGSHLYSFGFGGSDDDTGKAMIMDTYLANPCFGGDFKSAWITFVAGEPLFNAATGKSDGFMACFKNSSPPEPMWSRAINGDGEDRVLAAARGNGIWVAGDFTSKKLQAGTLSANNSGAGGTPTVDAFAARLGTGGTPIDLTGFGGSGEDSIQAVANDSLNNVFFAGYFTSPSISLGDTTAQNADGAGPFLRDVFIGKVSSTGTPMWINGFGGLQDDGGTALACKGTDLFLAGSYSSPTFSVGVDFTDYGSSDAFVGKFSP